MLASPPTSPSPSLPEEQILLDDIRAIGGPLYLFDAVNAAERARIAGVDDDLIVVALSSIGISQAHWQQNLLDRRTAPRVFSVSAAVMAAISLAVFSCSEDRPSPPVSQKQDASPHANVAAMLQAEGIGARNTYYPAGGENHKTVLLEPNEYISAVTYLPVPLRTDPPLPDNEGKILLRPFGSSGIIEAGEGGRCLIIDGKPETPVEVVEHCLARLR